MSLIEKIDSDVKQALKAGQKIQLDVLRQLRAMLQNAKILKQAVLKEADVLKVIQTELKKRKEAIEAYVKAGRKELAEKEQKEAEILTSYMPQQMTDGEIDEVITQTAHKVGATGKGDFGKLMGATMKEVGARADGNRVKERVTHFLENA